MKHNSEFCSSGYKLGSGAQWNQDSDGNSEVNHSLAGLIWKSPNRRCGQRVGKLFNMNLSRWHPKHFPAGHADNADPLLLVFLTNERS